MEFAYRLLAPPLFLPWVLTQFFAAGIAWFLLALWALWAWNTTVYYIPLFSFGIFVLVSPVQVNQRIVIGIIEQLASYLDTFFDDIIFPIIENFFYIVSPACWSYNFLWDGAMAILRIGVWNPVSAFLMAIFPVNPFDYIMSEQISAGAFPITTTIDTSSSPSWVVGPYDRATSGRRYAHLLNGSRSIDPSDPLSHNLIRWMRNRQGAGSTRHPKSHIRLVVSSSELDTWTHPEAPAFMRNTVAERVLRRTIDRELGIESKGWWEPEPDKIPEMWTGSRPPKWLEDSEWSRVFEDPTGHINWGAIGVVELDTPPELPEYAKERGLHIPPGSKSYRYLADDKGERALAFPELQAVATVISILFDHIANVFLEAIRIAFRIGAFMFSNVVDFFDDAIDMMANFMNQFFRQFLNLPCLRFDSIEVFAISLLDCICGPLRQAIQSLGQGWTSDYWNYQRPTDISELPQAIMSCIGLGCLDIDTIVAGGPTVFFSQLLGNCFQIPQGALCCILNPLNCGIAIGLEIIPCDCSNSGFNTNQPPQCFWPHNDTGIVFQCILRAVMKLLQCAKGGGDICSGFLFPGIGLSDFISCFASRLLDLDFFLEALEGLLFGGGGGFISEVTSLFKRSEPNPTTMLSPEEQFYIYGVRSNDAPKLYSRNKENEKSATLDILFETGGVGFVPDSPERPHGLDNLSRNEIRERIRRYRSKSLSLTAQNGSMPYTSNADLLRPMVDGVVVDNDYYGKDYQVADIHQRMVKHLRNAGGLDAEERVDLFEARMNHQGGVDPTDAFYSGKGDLTHDSSRMWRSFFGKTDAGAQSAWGGYTGAIWSNFMQTMERDSPTRHRARIRAHADRVLFNNPYIRIATGRFVGIVRDLIDYAETQKYGPDPFARRPADAEPMEPSDIRMRYAHHNNINQEAYFMHAQAVAENPYYAGLYKVMFQIGGPEYMDREGAQQDYDDTMEAMSLHKDEPTFHIGRMISASRQIYSAIGSVLEEVWWDPDSFSFHFPLYPQVHEVMLRSHLPTFMDDMRSAASSWMRCASADAESELNHETMRHLIEEEGRDPEMEASNYPFGVHGYSWAVQVEVAVRSAAIRLLTPRHLEPMLEQLATHSPIHAHYAYRMSQRVAALREASPHYETTFENDMDLMFEKYLNDAREEMKHEASMRAKAGFLGQNQLAMRLDPQRHPDLGNRSLSVGERVTFEDGRTGVFLGTQAHLDRSMVDRDSPTRSLFDERGVEIGPNMLQPRAYVVAIFKGIVKVFQVIWRYRKFIITGLVALVTTPWGRVIWESWLSFFWRRVVRPLYTKGLDSIFGSFTSVLELITDFATLNSTVILFLVNEMMRYILCGLWVFILAALWIPMHVIITWLSFGMLQIVSNLIVVLIIAVFIAVPNCPPEQVIDNNKMTQSPTQYLDDIVKCFGEVDLNDIPDKFGKGSYNGICHVPQDCPGNAPCVCENKGGQMSSVAVEFVDNTPCGTEQAPTGQCLCYPKYNCEFLLPRLGLQNLFDVDCRDYGYDLDNIVWYQTSDWFLIGWNAHNNFWVSLRYITRTLTRAPGIPPLLFPVLISVGMIVLLWVQLYTGAIVIGLVMGFEYGLPLWKKLVIDVILPGLRVPIDTGIPPFSNLADWIAGFFRFPNHTGGNPLGSMRSGEGICFIFNTGTLFGGAAVTFFFWGLVILLLWYGIGPILWLLYNIIMTPFRMLYAPLWFYLQQSGGQESVDAFKDNVRRFIPGASRAMDIGSDVWARSRPYREAMVPRQPDTFLNRWIGDRVPGIDSAFARYQNGPPAPIVIRGAMPGMGGGQLNHEIYRGTQTYAGADLAGAQYKKAGSTGEHPGLRDWAAHRLDADVRLRRLQRESPPHTIGRRQTAEITEVHDVDEGAPHSRKTTHKDK